jgi:hypothetical protein
MPLREWPWTVLQSDRTVPRESTPAKRSKNLYRCPNKAICFQLLIYWAWPRAVPPTCTYYILSKHPNMTAFASFKEWCPNGLRRFEWSQSLYGTKNKEEHPFVSDGLVDDRYSAWKNRTSPNTEEAADAAGVGKQKAIPGASRLSEEELARIIRLLTNGTPIGIRIIARSMPA